MNAIPHRIIITPGEPAGIGPDITLAIAQLEWPVELIVVADPDLLKQRAQQLNLPITLQQYDDDAAVKQHQPGRLSVLSTPLAASVTPGALDPANAQYVLRTLEIAAGFAAAHKVAAIVTGPVHKGILNQAGINFSGHTEYFAQYCDVPKTVMLFVVDQLKVALATTHLPLAAVPAAITTENLRTTLTILHTELKQKFGLAHPRIAVCGLNPHAGENGYLGREEIDTIAPCLIQLRNEQFNIQGPFSADTIFTPQQLAHTDAVLAMYHDQALPLVKYIGFNHAVNVTLGLPFIRTSVDHGTAIDLAGTGKADAGSLQAALNLAIQLSQ